MARNLAKRELKEMLLRKEITVGFSKDRKKIVFYTDHVSFALHAKESGIERDRPMPMGIKITPENVKCDYIGLVQNKYLIFGLGQNRSLTLGHLAKDEIRVTYLPDEADLEYGRSEFMIKCKNRGLI